MSELASIEQHLRRRFFLDGQRLIFWNDAKNEYGSDLDQLDIPDVNIVRVENNECALKYRLLKREPRSRFLVYRAGPAPRDIDNWLLDLELANGVFTADRASLIMQELGLTETDHGDVIKSHLRFFDSAKRTQDLKARVAKSDDARTLQAKMVAILIGQKQHSLSEIWRTLLEQNSRGEISAIREIEKHGFSEFHWEGTRKIYGYESDSPSVDDFVLWLFGHAVNNFQSDVPNALRNIRIDFGNLRYDSRFREAYGVLAQRVTQDLDYEQAILTVDFRELIHNDLFDVIDLKIISDLARGVADRTLLSKEVSEWILQRRKGFWFESFEHLYAAIEAAACLLAEIEAVSFTVSTFEDGLTRYQKDWFHTDQLYRQFIYHASRAEYGGPLEELRVQVERFYTNHFLIPLGTEWQRHLDSVDRWHSHQLPSQTRFFANRIEPTISHGNKKIAVIISDALRYEAAEELGSLIRREDRFDAELSAMLSTLPSFTQLGMAALLPHTQLTVLDGDKALVHVDGERSVGTANRAKILESVKGTAVLADDLLGMSREEARDLFRSHQVVYVYHNRIDETGDNAKSESRVFEAVEQTFTEIIELIKKLAAANANNFLVTSDHGFLYQNEGLDESGYLSVAPQGEVIAYRDRRFVLGKGLKADPAFMTFTSDQINLDSELEVQIPKSIHRLRLQGSGSRYVHGGASLQEVVVPVLSITKKRSSDVTQVDVKILAETDVITTGQISIRLFQTQAVSEKVQPRTLKAGLYVGDQLISNEELLSFIHGLEDARERYQSVQLILSKEADGFNGRAVEFRLSEQIPNTSQWRVYAKTMFTLRRSFMLDF